MREEDSTWFARWEEELPPPDELIPLSQTLISPDLALAFDIRNPGIGNGNGNGNGNSLSQQLQLVQQQPLTSPCNNNSSNPLGSSDFAAENSAELGSGGAGGDEPARTLKRPRLVWTPQLHKRFVDAVAHLGIKNAVPKTIMQLMSVDGLTRENVASHLQKYRLYLKRMQGLSSGGGSGAGVLNGGVAGGVTSDPATDHLFASSPVPAHFLHPGARGNSDHFLPYVPVAIHQQQMAMAGAVGNPHLQSHQYHRQLNHFGSPTNGQFEHHLFARQAQPQQVHRMGQPVHSTLPSSYIEDLESPNGERKILTLFPTGDD